MLSVITISRGTMSGGMLIAEQLSKSLGYRCIDRDVIVEKAAASGVSHKELRSALDKPPTFLERFRHKKRLYLALIKAALTEELRTGKAIYHGNAGHLLLKGGGPVFRVRIIAPLSFRIAIAQQRLHFSEEEAETYIRRKDEDRKRWAHYLYGVDWTDPSLYDMVVNLEYIDVEDAADTVSHLIRRQACFDFDAKCQSYMNDLAIASRVGADLALHAATEHIEFEVDCQAGCVSIAGKLTSVDLYDEVKRVAEATPGVTEVDLTGLVTVTPA
jgi:cytidylate kinase